MQRRLEYFPVCVGMIIITSMKQVLIVMMSGIYKFLENSKEE